MPNLIAYDVCGVQPMNGPTGLIFAMKSKYTGKAGQEALFDEASTDYSGLTSGSTGNGFGVFTAGGDGGRHQLGCRSFTSAGDTLPTLPGDGFSTS